MLRATRFSGRYPASMLLLLVAVSACTREAPPEPAEPEAATAQDAVVVYAAYDDKSYLPELFTQFTAATGTVVIVRNGEIPGIVDDVIQKRSTPPADVLITPSVAGVWRVAEESELRPNYSANVAGLPAWLQDPDKYWTAISYHTAMIVHDPAQIDVTALGAYEDLADEALRHKLCLSSSTLAVNRAVIAMLVQKLGKREAELAVRGWVANLAQPPFDSESRLLRAIASGECAVGIVSSKSLAGTRLGVHAPTDLYFDIEAIGVTRHARNPEAAMALVDWLLTPEVQTRHAMQTGALPVGRDESGLHSIAAVAVGLEEAVKLAERARYR